MMELPKIVRLSLLGAGLLAALGSAACSEDGSSGGTGGAQNTGGSVQNTGGGTQTTGGTGPGTGGATGSGGTEAQFPFCAPVSTCPPDVTGVDLTTPVEFRRDIYASFLQSGCGGGSLCHGNNATGYRFGTAEKPLTDAEITALIAQFKDEMSPVANIPNVVAGDWQNSYLMMKLDGCQNEMGLNCNSDAQGLSAAACEQECSGLICPPLPCGDGMPAALSDNTNDNAVYPLSDAQRHAVRAWIAQGALDN